MPAFGAEHMSRPTPLQAWPAAVPVDSDHRDSLRRAARRLPNRTDLAQVFFEDRTDLVVTASRGASAESALTRTVGLRARSGGSRPRAVFLAGGTPRHAEPLVRRFARGDDEPVSPRDAGAGPPPGDMPAGEAVVEEIAGRLEDRARGRLEDVRYSLRFVAFRQRVYLADSTRVLSDLRRGARVRLEVRGATPGSTAVVELAMRSASDADRLASIAEEAIERCSERRRVRPLAPGEYAAVFAPGVAGVLAHEIVGHALEADRGRALARGPVSVGARLAPSHVTVVDDPRRGRGAWRIDDEGVEPRATSLIERGRVAGLLHDRRSASATGSAPTGHGRRSSFREPVRPRMGCTYLAPGPFDAGEIVRDTPSGIYVRRMEAASTDPRAAHATFRVRDADRIVDGRLSSPVEGFLLRVETASALDGLDRVADDLRFDTCVGSCVRHGQPLVTSVGAPTCRVTVVTVVA